VNNVDRVNRYDINHNLMGYTENDPNNSRMKYEYDNLGKRIGYYEKSLNNDRWVYHKY